MGYSKAPFRSQAIDESAKVSVPATNIPFSAHLCMISGMPPHLSAFHSRGWQATDLRRSRALTFDSPLPLVRTRASASLEARRSLLSQSKITAWTFVLYPYAVGPPPPCLDLRTPLLAA